MTSRRRWACVGPSPNGTDPVRTLPALLLFCGHCAGAAEIQLAPLSPRAGGRSGFSALPSSQTGISFTNHLSAAAAARNRIYELGSGVALGDVDGDGLVDVCLARMEGDNALFRNLGNWRFEDVTAKAGVACPNQFSTGVALVDVDRDGDLDLLVTGIGSGARLFKNNGKGIFHEALDSGLSPKFGATSMALADIDGDGDLDLYVCNYRTTTTKDNPNEVKVDARLVNGRIVVTPADRFEPVVSKGGGVIVVEKGEPDFLCLNDGHGRFTPVSWTDGRFLDEDGKPLSHPPRDWALAAAFRDLSGDGLPDLYVCNDFFQSPDRVWINQGGGKFRAVDRLALRNMSLSSMSIDFADINRDGWDDFFVADMLSPRNEARQRQRANVLKGDLDLPIADPAYRPEVLRNTLCLSRGDGTFAEIAQLAGLEATDWTWGSVFLDVDLDGYEDLLLTTGNLHDVLDADAMQSRAPRMPPLDTACRAYRNNGDLTFSEKGADWGFNFTGISQGIATADLDGDGDLDVVVNRMNSPAGSYRNNSPAPRLLVRIPATAVGAKIKVSGSGPPQTQTVIAGGRYLSSDDGSRAFAAGLSNVVEVFWPSGKYSKFAGLAPNQRCDLREPAGPALAPEKIDAPPPLFEEVRVQALAQLDGPFDDFARQPLLPHRLNQFGPPVAWMDLNGDGHLDLFVGASRGGQPQAFLGGAPAALAPFSIPAFGDPVTRDQMAVAIASPPNSAPAIFILSSNYEDGLGLGPAVRRLQSGKFADVVGATTNSPGALAVADVDGDGAIDLFVGGRVRPGRYPEAADSFVYLGNGRGGFAMDSRNQKTFAGVGLVTGAVFADFDGDGDPDLAVSCDWGSPRIFLNKSGVFSDATASWGLAALTGWWTSIAAGDFDGDGSIDLVLGNIGRNTKYQRRLPDPIRIYYGDLDGDGALEIIESWRDSASGQYVPVRDFESLSRAIPGLPGRITSFAAFGRSSIDQILGEAAQKMRMLEAGTPDSCVLFNRRDHFQFQPLPVQAQYTPVMSIALGDVNLDKKLDLFLGQNFFGVETETSRHDAGLGLVLLNQTNGFKPLSAAESGIRIYGEQRGAALGDFDGDGRPDLAVAQHAGPVRVFRNAGSKRP